MRGQETAGQLRHRAEQESLVLAGLAGLAISEREYDEAVEAALQLVEPLIACPLLCLSVREPDGMGHYIRVGRDIDQAWAEDAGRALADLQEREMAAAVAPSASTIIHPLPAEERRDTADAGLTGWSISFIVGTSSGRVGALGLATPEPRGIDPAEQAMMLRLAQQVVLVLDHALLVQQAEQTGTVDGLTGVANQRRLLDLLDYELRRHRHTRTRLSLMLVDVEGLDGINRSYGHSYGDHILRKLAALIQESARPIDVVARCGLDDFAVILPETDEEEALRRAEAMRERFLGVEFAGGHIGIAVAVAHAGPHETISPERLIRRAEQALADTKRQERSWDIALSR